MDRLVIESILADVDEIFLPEDKNIQPTLESLIFLGFKAGNQEKITHAFSELKKLVGQHEVSLIICKTLVSGMYDIEILTDALDEPIKIFNKVISDKFLSSIQDKADSNNKFNLGTNGSKEENWMELSKMVIKDCNVSTH